MKQLLIQFNTAIVLLLVSSFYCHGADKYTLEYNLEKGKTYKQHLVTDMNMAMSAMGQNFNVNMKMEMGANYEVLNKENDVFSVRMSYQRIKINITSPAAITINTDSLDNFPDKNTGEAIKSLTKSPLDIKLTKQGKVLSVEGIDLLTAKVNAIANPQMKQILSQQFSEQEIKKLIEQMSAYFPDKPVGIGDSWDTTTNLKANGVEVINKMHLTLKQVQDNLIFLDFTGTVATPEGGSHSNFNGADAKVMMDGTQKGTIQLDKNSGWIIRGETTMKSLQNIEVSGQTIVQNMAVKSTMTGE